MRYFQIGIPLSLGQPRLHRNWAHRPRQSVRGHESEELLREGWCWWYKKYAPGDTVLEGLEKEA